MIPPQFARSLSFDEMPHGGGRAERQPWQLPEQRRFGHYVIAGKLVPCCPVVATCRGWGKGREG